MQDIEQIINLYKQNKIQFTVHALKRCIERNISITNDIFPAILNGEIIEIYPEDYPYKSYLIFGITMNNQPIHIVCAIGEDVLWIITSYFPNIAEWENNFKTRKRV